MLKKSLVEKNGYFTLNCPYAEFYVPRYFTADGMAADAGEYFNCFGLFYVRTFNSVNGNPDNFEILKLPSMINLYPTEKENRKMTIMNVEDDYIVLKFFKGDTVMPAAVTCSNAMPEFFLNLLLRGRIPKNIPYNHIIDAFIKVFSLNKIGMPCPTLTLEMIITEVYRYKQDTSLKYAEALADKFDPKKPQLDYTTANIRDICKANSSFAGVSFENIDEMITSAINKKRSGSKETYTPFEDVIKY